VSGPILSDWQEAQVYLKSLEGAFTVTEQVRKARPAAIDPPHVDRRLAVQGSHFTIFGKSKDLTKSEIVNIKIAAYWAGFQRQMGEPCDRGKTRTRTGGSQ
jgi:hypothetical protein